MTTFKNFASPHCHLQSLDTGSTIEEFIRREKELETGVITCTDHGYLGACRDVYKLAKENGLKPILGIEGYHRDDDCLILQKHGFTKDPKKNTYENIYKYGHITIHAIDQSAYEKIIKKVSLRDLTAEAHGSERKPIFTWSDLEEIGSENVTMTSGCLIGIVGRHIKDGRPEVAVDYYKKIRNLVKPGNFYVELFTHKCDKNWVNGVFITLENGEKLKFYHGKKVKTSKHEEISVSDLVKSFNRSTTVGLKLLAIKNRNVFADLPVPLEIVKCEHVQDFIQNECLPWCPDGDIQAGLNKFLAKMAATYGDKILISDDAHYAYKDEKIIQEAKLGGMGDSFRFYGDYHRYSSDEAFGHFKETLGMSEREFEGLLNNNLEWASKFNNFKIENSLSLPTKFYPEDTFGHLLSLIKKHGRMDWNNPKMVKRLESEITLLHRNGTIDLLPYFFLAEEATDLYEKNGQLTGGGRGSAAGMLSAYLLSITHVNPLDYNLSQDRFLTEDRIKTGKLPDIDQDLPDRKLLLPWLKERFGDCYSQVSTNNMLRLKSSIKDVARATWGSIPPEIEQICKDIPDTPQGVEDLAFINGYVGEDLKEVKGELFKNKSLQGYVAKYPDQWKIVLKLLGIVRAKSRHASAYIIANKPIDSFIPLMTVNDTRVTQYTAKSCEDSGALKMDYLCLNTLKDLGHAIKLIQERSGLKFDRDIFINGERIPPIRQVPINGKIHNIWKLPEDQAVFRSICEGKTETVFQLNTNSAKKWLHEFNFWKNEDEGKKSISSIEDISAFTALDRPGPLDAEVLSETGQKRNMLEEFAARARGEKSYGAIDFMDKELPETNGVMVYQEQLQSIFQKLTDCSGIDANNFRADISKKEMKKVKERFPLFMEKSKEKVSAEESEKIWDQTVTFGQYGFNKSMDGNTILYSWNDKYKKIKDFQAGDIVQGVNDTGAIIFTKVMGVHDHGDLEGLEITFEDGYTVTSSENHKFLTKYGQIPLWKIIQDGLEVLCGPSNNQNVDIEVWKTDVQSTNNESSSKDLLGVHSDQKKQYSATSIKTQHKSRTKGGGIQGRTYHVCEKGHPTTKSGKAPCLASRASVRNSSNLGVSEKGRQKIKNGVLVAKKSNNNLARSTNSMWDGKKTSGFCKSKSQNLDRDRWVFSFFRDFKTKIKAINHSGQRCNVKSRSHSQTERNATSIFWRMFPKLRWKNETRMPYMAFSDAPLTSTGSLVPRKIIRIRSVGKKRMYDLEVSHPKHNFLLPNGIITSNSHSVAYASTAYICAYFKHHFPLEWWCAVLRNAVEKDKNEVAEEFWKYCKDYIKLPDITYSESEFVIKDNKIIAPLKLLQGVGDGAHEELFSNRPYTDIYDFCEKIAKTKLKKTRFLPDGTSKAGISSLNRGVVSKLIVSGVMDSLFPVGGSIVDKLELFEAALAKSLGKKRPEKIKDEYRNLTSLQVYQHKKQILPIYSENLIPQLYNLKMNGIDKKKVKINNEEIERYSYHPRDLPTIEYILKSMDLSSSQGPVSFVDGPFLKYLNEDVIIDEDTPIHVTVAAYVVDVRKFTYKDKKTGKTLSAAEVVLDVDGEVLKTVKWPTKKKKELILPEGDLIGSICVVLMSRWNQRYGFSVDAIIKGYDSLGDTNGKQNDSK